jgi:hypothetical protein
VNEGAAGQRRAIATLEWPLLRPPFFHDVVEFSKPSQGGWIVRMVSIATVFAGLSILCWHIKLV